jgi:hypothetical protein
MDAAGAKAVLLRHVECGPEDDTLLSGLRPYRGVEDRHLAEILHALLVAAPGLNGPAKIDRELVHAVWELCRTVRAWTCGPHEPMFHGRQFIPPAEKRRLDSWVDRVESIMLSLLRGDPVWSAFLGLPWYVVEWGLGPRAAFLAPLFTEMLQRLAEEGADADDEINLCRALETMGPAARVAAARIHTLSENSPNPEVRAAAAEALRAIT